MGNMKPHTIKFTEEQWQIICEFAESKNITAGQFVRDAIYQRLRIKNIEWPGSPSWGGVRPLLK